jgi:hypothetical protein
MIIPTQRNIPDSHLHQAIRLEIVTLIWMVFEAFVAIVAAWARPKPVASGVWDR